MHWLRTHTMANSDSSAIHGGSSRSIAVGLRADNYLLEESHLSAIHICYYDLYLLCILVCF